MTQVWSPCAMRVRIRPSRGECGHLGPGVLPAVSRRGRSHRVAEMGLSLPSDRSDVIGPRRRWLAAAGRQSSGRLVASAHAVGGCSAEGQPVLQDRIVFHDEERIGIASRRRYQAVLSLA